MSKIKFGHAVIFTENGREYIKLSGNLGEYNYQHLVNTFIPKFEEMYNTPLYVETENEQGLVYHVDNTPKNRMNYIRMVLTIMCNKSKNL